MGQITVGGRKNKTSITFGFHRFEQSVKYKRTLTPDDKGEIYNYFTDLGDEESTKTNKFTNLKRILNKYNDDPFIIYSDTERFKIFKERDLLKDEPEHLPLFIKSVHWSFTEMKIRAHKMLKLWAPIDTNTALNLLQNECSDKTIRQFAVKKLNQLPNREFADLMPQLVQALKFESHHESYLGSALLTRSLESPRVVGHAYFWALNASLYDKYSFERLYMHYERFLFVNSHYRNELYFQK